MCSMIINHRRTSTSISLSSPPPSPSPSFEASNVYMQYLGVSCCTSLIITVACGKHGNKRSFPPLYNALKDMDTI
eukprot:m.5143 g.5143  ORF g.5143 m.5143 type:complete len:75 (+) comp4837_c0_seq2:1330-1554(+)